ncbi:hypothetical protein ACFL4L_02625 [bacterium]
MKIDIISESNVILNNLQENDRIAQYLDPLPIPRPYTGNGLIKLIILGQDPTVKNAESRMNIYQVLNLDKEAGALYKYLDNICKALELDLKENVYATNVIKNFFTEPPTVIYESTGIDVLQESAPLWLPLLQQEIDQLPNIPIISLGEPILNVLVKNGSPLMKTYWGYTEIWQNGHLKGFSKIAAEKSVIHRPIFPVVHQPAKNILFYKYVTPLYINYVRNSINLYGPNFND